MAMFDDLQARYNILHQEDMSLEDYLELCKTDPNAYASAAERMVRAIGEPTLIDTRENPILSRIFSNKVIPHYECFSDFFGMEETIAQIVSYFKHAAQGLEERKQILYAGTLTTPYAHSADQPQLDQFKPTSRKRSRK